MAVSQVATTKVRSDEVEKWQATNPVAELSYSQKEVARFLELGYLALRDHPKVAAEIRITANMARTQHVLTSGLFKKFVATADSVVNTYCPMMMDALELQDKDILKEAFEQVLEMCLDMKKETEAARDSYLQITKTVQENLGMVNMENEKIKSRTEIIEQTKKAEHAQLKELEKQQENLAREKENLAKNVEKLTQNRDDNLEKSATTGDAMDTFIDTVMSPADMLANPVGTLTLTLFCAVDVVRGYSKGERALEASREANKQLQKARDDEQKVSETLYKRRKEALEKIAHIEALELEKSSFGDIKSLREAILQLGNVDKQFTKIVLFWDSMATMLKHLHQNQKAGGAYLKKIEVDSYAEKFKSSINKTEERWTNIGRICMEYVNNNDKVILNVYGFLSDPVDNMSDEEIRIRKASLIQKIKDEAEQLDNSN